MGRGGGRQPPLDVPHAPKQRVDLRGDDGARVGDDCGDLRDERGQADGRDLVEARATEPGLDPGELELEVGEGRGDVHFLLHLLVA